MSAPRILLIDFETFPNLGYTWGSYEQNVIEIVEDWYILSAAWRWYGTRPIFVEGLDDHKQFSGGAKNWEGPERRLMKRVHSLMDEADMILAHNGIDFDIKVANTRLLVHGFAPPSPYKPIDTKRAAKQAFRFSSNKLDNICRQLGIGRKVQHEGFPLWTGCAAGDPAAWRKMKRYNRHDVRILGDLYAKIAPWIRQPNAAVFEGDARCVNPACRSTDLEKRGTYQAVTRVYQRWVCGKCGRWCRSVLAERKPRALTVAAL